MISMRKNGELFFILEMLLLTPVALFWVGLVSMMLGSNSLLMAVVGEPFSMIRLLFVTIFCPTASAWFAYEYIIENKKEKGPVRDIAKTIIAISLATIVLVVIYFINGNFLQV